MIEDNLAHSERKGDLSTAPSAVPSSVDAGRNEGLNEDVIPDSSEQGGSGKQVPEASDYSESKKAIGDKLIELGQLFHKDTDHQSKIINGQVEILERMNQLGRDIAPYFSNIIARQDEVVERVNVANAETKQCIADLGQQFLRLEKQLQDNHVHTVKIREQHHKEVLAKKERNEREEKRRFEKSERQSDQDHTEIMAKLDRQDDGITQILTRLEAVERSRLDPRRADATGRRVRPDDRI